MNNPWFDGSNPYIAGCRKVPVYVSGPLACVVDGNNAPLYNPLSVDEDTEYLSDISNTYLEIGNEAKLRYAYLKWKHWEETNGRTQAAD